MSRPPPRRTACGILVVDDDARLAATLQELLRAEGYAVEVALSAAEALAIYERNPGIAVALVDLIMPVHRRPRADGRAAPARSGPAPWSS